MASLSVFGERLRGWRKRRGLSQLDLAVIAGTTPRYVSFVETGRSRPGRGVVLRLADAMNVPLRDRNALLLAAGLPPAFAESALNDVEMKPVRKIVDLVLANHEPYPGIAFGSGFRILKVNRAAERVFPGMTAMTPEQMIDMWFGPGPGRDMVENWEAGAHAGVASLRQEYLRSPTPELGELVRRAEAHIADLGPAPDSGAYDQPVVCSTMKFGAQRVRTIATVMRFDKPTDVTTSELRVELMFPADAESEAFFRNLVE